MEQMEPRLSGLCSGAVERELALVIGGTLRAGTGTPRRSISSVLSMGGVC